MAQGNKIKTDERNHRRAFGQNFLIDDTVIQNIIADIQPEKAIRIIEIGPGKGALTRGLVAACPNVTAIELDGKCVEFLRKRKEFSRLEIIKGDAAATPLDGPPFTSELKGLPVLVGNLPYNQAGPIIRHFLPAIKSFRFFYFMVQYEVAKRLTAAPHSKSFSALSVFTQNFADATLQLKIPQGAFRPKPKVFSATVKFTARKEALCTDPLFFPFVKQAFSQKRKQLPNSLEQMYSRRAVKEALTSLKLSDTIRAEDMTIEELKLLFEFLKS